MLKNEKNSKLNEVFLMLIVKSSVCVNAPTNKVWRYLSDVENINLWVTTIKTAYSPTDAKSGLGIERICKLDKFDVNEIFVEWNEGIGFKYIATGAPMIKSASNKWSIEAVGDETLITSYSEIIVKGGIFGRLLEPVIFLATRFAFPNALAPLKYLIENDRPFNGNARDLPKALAFC